MHANVQLLSITIHRKHANYDNRQESILLICVRSDNLDNYEFGYACIGIFDYQIIGF